MNKKLVLVLLVGMVWTSVGLYALGDAAPLPRPRSKDFVAPEQKITGAEIPVPLGELVDIGLTPIKDKPDELQTSTYSWMVLCYDSKGNVSQKRFRQASDGSIFFSSGLIPKKLLVVCVATHLFVVKDGDKVKEVALRQKTMTATVTIEGPGPTPPGPDPVPPPPVPPPPGPDPVFPDGKYKLAAFAYKSAKTKVSFDAERAKAAMALSESFRSIAAAIAAGTLSTPKDILDKTKESNISALKKVSDRAVSNWESFSTDLQNELYRLYKDGTLKTADDFKVAWGELADGLSKVK